jgi:hypothetical protein
MNGRQKSGRTDETIECKLGLGRHHRRSWLEERNDVLGQPRPSSQHHRRLAQLLSNYPYLAERMKEGKEGLMEGGVRIDLKKKVREIQYRGMRRAEGDKG